MDRPVFLSLLALSVLCLASMISIAYAAPKDKGGGPAGYLYVDGAAVNDKVDVYPGSVHSIQVRGLPAEINSGFVWIKVSDPESDWRKVSYSDGNTAPFGWTVPYAPESTTYVVQYKDWDGDPPWTYIAQGQIRETGHLHVVPEIALGAAGSLVIAIAALAVFAARRRR